jgi:hypothetical protein
MSVSPAETGAGGLSHSKVRRFGAVCAIFAGKRMLTAGISGERRETEEKVEFFLMGGFFCANPSGRG